VEDWPEAVALNVYGVNRRWEKQRSGNYMEIK
jgi:hypothetical protein